jgi:hypothetical protein
MWLFHVFCTFLQDPIPIFLHSPSPTLFLGCVCVNLSCPCAEIGLPHCPPWIILHTCTTCWFLCPAAHYQLHWWLNSKLYTPQKDKLGISRVLLVKVVSNYQRLSSSSSSVVPLGVFEKNRTSWDFLILKTSKYYEYLHWNFGYGPWVMILGTQFAPKISMTVFRKSHDEKWH